ncbi:SMI1/KNR4 family protein [Paracoccus caeni]|uniref:SMI1/KNR4 family protein n=1 Tax=Paracoccus caeni TaxID=657651 RepID=A0A934SIG8_9RHOB|nr:SMI1/KNR4 family protein [Paracoccus caeni]MBK4218243.1 SMI1/KNR4 family protein [Paracoccus caeni]
MMTGIKWNPAWQLDPPAQIDINPDGTVTFEGPVGNVLLPKEYLDFLLISDGAALRDRGSWFLARFQNGLLVGEIEWLGGIDTVMGTTWNLYVYPDPEKNKVPDGFINVGFAPGQEDMDILLNVNRSSSDFGKVYAWINADDPWMIGDNTRGLGFVANSFNEFMNNLTDRKNL